MLLAYGPRQANLVLIAYASSEGSGEPAHPRSLARTFAARSYKQWVKRNLQTGSQIPGPSEWLGMRSWNLSWRNARRHKFAWRGSYIVRKHAPKCVRICIKSLKSDHHIWHELLNQHSFAKTTMKSNTIFVQNFMNQSYTIIRPEAFGPQRSPEWTAIKA